MADVKVSFSGDDYKLYRSFQRTMDKMQGASQKASQGSARSAKQSGDSWKKNNEDSFGSGALSQVKGYIAGIVGIGSAIQAVKAGFGELNRMREEGAQKQKRALLPMASLAQLSGGDPKRMQELVRMTNELYARGGASTLAESAETVFQTVSSGFEGDKKFISQLFPVFNDPGAMLSAVAGIKTGLGTDESLQDIVSRALVASGKAPSKAEEILTGLAPNLGQLGGSGTDIGELLSAMSPLSTIMGSQRAGTAIGAFLRATGKKEEFKGKGLIEITDMISEMGLEGKDLTDFLQDAQAVSTFRLLKENRRAIQFGRLSSIQGTEERLAERVLATASTDPTIRAIRADQKEEALLEISQQREAMEYNLSNAVLQRRHRYYMRTAKGNALAEIGGGTKYALNKTIQYLNPSYFLQKEDLEQLSSWNNAPDPNNLPEDGGGSEAVMVLKKIEQGINRGNAKREKPTADSLLNSTTGGTAGIEHIFGSSDIQRR